MIDEYIWILKPQNDNKNYEKIMLKISNNQDINLSNYIVNQVADVVSTFRSEFLEYIKKFGLSSFLQQEFINEQVIKKGVATSSIIPIFHNYLDDINIKDELIIVDPYFYSKTKDTNYPKFVSDILVKYLADITNLIIVTDRIDKTTQHNIDVLLKATNPSLNIVCKKSQNYHDRFWISDSRTKGILVGSSLNGIGKKLAVVDKLNDSDVSTIINELTNDSLL